MSSDPLLLTIWNSADRCGYYRGEAGKVVFSTDMATTGAALDERPPDPGSPTEHLEVTVQGDQYGATAIR